MAYLFDSDKPLVLSSSRIGNVSRCACCSSYHLCIGSITLRLEHKYMMALAQMIIEALEVSTAVDQRMDGQAREHA